VVSYGLIRMGRQSTYPPTSVALELELPAPIQV